jgi:Tol biopolymer transport system component
VITGEGSKTSITTELMHGGWSPGAPAVSPDGRWVAWVTGPVKPRGPPHAALWLAPVDGSAAAKCITDGSRRVSMPRWTPDSATLIHLADGSLVRLGLDGEQAEVTAWTGWVGDVLPLDGGRLVLLGESDDEESGNGVTVWSGVEAPTGDRLLLLAPGHAAPRELTALGHRHVTAAVARPDGAALAVISRPKRWPKQWPDPRPNRRHQGDHAERHPSQCPRPLGPPNPRAVADVRTLEAVIAGLAVLS